METIQAMAWARDLPISTKKSVDICTALKGTTVKRAKNYLLNVIANKEAIPTARHKKDIPHKPGRMAGGIYPEKCAFHILKVIDLAEKNAAAKGMNIQNLRVHNIRADQAGRPFHSGRQGRLHMKRTHIQVVVQEIAQPKMEKKTEKKAKEEKKQ